MRITKGINRGQQASFSFNGTDYAAYEGESVACALFAAGVANLRSSPRGQEPRGMFCLMGSCQECLVWIDGRKTPACQHPVTNGLTVTSIDDGGMS